VAIRRFWFLILGSIMTGYIIFAMVTHRSDFKGADGLLGLGMSLSATLSGLMIVWLRPFKTK